MWIFSSRSVAGSSAPPNMCPKWKPTRKAHGLLISHVPPQPLGLVFLPLNSRPLKKPLNSRGGGGGGDGYVRWETRLPPRS